MSVAMTKSGIVYQNENPKFKVSQIVKLPTNWVEFYKTSTHGEIAGLYTTDSCYVYIIQVNGIMAPFSEDTLVA